MAKEGNSSLVMNRAARHHYEVLETWEAGLVLWGTEIKSLRAHGGNLQDAYVLIDKGEAFLKNSSISPYAMGSWHNHEDRRSRKLLLHKRELRLLEKIVTRKGLAVIPLEIFLKKGLAKVRIASCRGKKLYDKRRAAADKTAKRAIEQALKDR